jgi:hypothetical protein
MEFQRHITDSVVNIKTMGCLPEFLPKPKLSLNFGAIDGISQIPRSKTGQSDS